MSLKFGKTIRTLRFSQNYLFLIKKKFILRKTYSRLEMVTVAILFVENKLLVFMFLF